MRTETGSWSGMVRSLPLWCFSNHQKTWENTWIKMAHCRIKNVGNNFARRNGNDRTFKGKNTKLHELYLKTQLVPRSKQFLSAAQTWHPHPLRRKCRWTALPLLLRTPAAVDFSRSISLLPEQHPDVLCVSVCLSLWPSPCRRNGRSCSRPRQLLIASSSVLMSHSGDSTAWRPAFDARNRHGI